MIKSLHKSYIKERNTLSKTYNTILKSLLPDLKNNDLSDLILKQLLSLEKHYPYLNT